MIILAVRRATRCGQAVATTRIDNHRRGRASQPQQPGEQLFCLADRTARIAASRGQPLPLRYARSLGVWAALGVPALFSFLAIFYLMTAKPALH
ncbi:DUF2269 family protein [Stenotrophomonas pennii]|uniref:DUF2269 family protein n=1 Tax=Stenotrophomonas lacuserhaii TaxID=2760084 RepID=UPI003208F7DF